MTPRPQIAARGAALALALALLALPSLAAANSSPYQFDPMCAPKTTFDTSLAIPLVHFVLDRSGSMGGTKWSTAKSVLKELADSTHRSGPCNPPAQRDGCDEIFMGLSWFSGGAGLVANPGDDTRDTIKSWLDSNNPSGGTNMDAGTKQISQNTTFSATNRVRIGAFITDGGPNPASTAADARTNLCAARSNGVISYVIGFGTGTNQGVNNFLAAAGGTGTCCAGASCTYQPSELVDPCLLNPTDMLTNGFNLSGDYKCTGSLQANTGQALKTALMSVIAAASCTFPLDIPAGYPAAPGADEDPRATFVSINHATFGPDLQIPFASPANNTALRDFLVNVRLIDPSVADLYISQGFTWANATRTAVRLTPGLCNEIAAGNVTITETQVACLCVNTGDPCQVDCTSGYNDGSACAGGKKVGRCAQGTVICNYGVEECEQRYRPMPESCNGLDDNCDGITDNMESGDPGRASSVVPWKGQALQPVPSGKEGMFCAFQPSSCSCSGVDPDSYGAAPALNQPEWPLYVASYSGSCKCMEGLDAPELLTSSDPSNDNFPWADSDPRGDSDPQAASCAAAPAGAASGSALLLMVGLMLLGLRRARRDA